MPFRLVPPLEGPLWIWFAPCSIRSTGRPRPTPDVGSMGRQFHALRDKVFRRDVLWRA